MILGTAAALLGLLGLIPLILLHLRNNRRKAVKVSSLLLWQFAVRKKESTIRRRITDSLHLLLQLLVLLLLVTAAADPMLPLPGLSEREGLVIILDGSAGMTLIEGRTSRFEQAQSEVRKLINSRRGKEAALILAGSEPQLLSGFSSSGRQLLTALEQAAATAGTTDIGECLDFARNLAGERKVEIYLVSDGCFTLERSEEDFIFYPVGREATSNTGITGFNARRDEERTDRHHLFAALYNASPREETKTVRLSLNDRILETREVILPPETELTQHFTLDCTEGRVKLSLFSGPEYSFDAFPMDDAAYLSISNTPPLNLLLVTGGNYYLESLLKIMPGVSLTVSPTLIPALFDVIIFDGPAAGALPPGNYIFWGTPPPGFPVETTGEWIDFPGTGRWDSAHPLLKDIDPRSFTVYRAYATRPEENSPALPLLEGEVPLIYAYDDGPTRAVYMTFSLSESNLPLRTAFPVLTANALSWLHKSFNTSPYDNHPGGRSILLTDTTASARLAAAAEREAQAFLLRPDGTETELMLIEGELRFHPREPGFYTIRTGGGEEVLAVNLLSAEESDLRRRFEPAGAVPAGEGPEERIGESPESPPEEGYLHLWPLFLAAGALLLLLERFLARRGRIGAGRRGRTETALTAAAALLLLTAGFSPVLPLGERGLSIIYLLDTSHSIPVGSREGGLAWIHRTAEKAGDLKTTALLTFGEEPRMASPPGPILTREALETLAAGGETNPEKAVRRALTLLPASGDRRLILLSDGNETEGNLLDLLSSLHSPGLSIHTLPLTGESGENEMLIRSFTGPETVSPREKFSLTLEVNSREFADGVLYFYLDGEYYGEDLLSLRSGNNQFAYSFLLEEPGFHRIEAILHSEADTWYENNRFRKTIFASGDPPLLYIREEGEFQKTDASLAGLMEAQGYTVDRRTPAAFPGSLSELYSYQAVILDNVSAYALSYTEMDLLKKAVAGGLGLLVSGGDTSFGLGGYYKTPLEEVLPVDVDIASSMDLPETVILMLIDKSGTMRERAEVDEEGEARLKIDLAKQAVMAAVEVLEPSHQAGVLSFDAAWEWTAPFTPSGDTESILHRISGLTPGGGTVLYPALEEALRALTEHTAAVKHLLILSDGHTDEEDFEGLTQTFRDRGITISTVAVGRGADRDLMENLARWGEGRSYYAEGISEVPAIFADESLKASRRLTVEQTFFPDARIGHPVLKGVADKYIPPLEGFLLSYRKDEGELLLGGVDGHPLLSVRQYGLGRTAAFTSSLDSSWTAEWNSWEGYPRLFSQLIRWLSRGRPEQGITFDLTESSRGAEISVDARHPEEGFLNHLSLRAQVITPDLEELTVPIPQTGPGRYRGRFPLTKEGDYFVTLIKEDKEDVTTDTRGTDSFELPESGEGADKRTGSSDPGAAAQVTATAVYTRPYPDEFNNPGPDVEFMKKAARLTGGTLLFRENIPEDEFFEPAQDLPAAPLPLRPGLILGALLLFLTALAFRLLPGGLPHKIRSALGTLYHRLFGKTTEEDYRVMEEKLKKEKAEREKPVRDEDFWFGGKGGD